MSKDVLRSFKETFPDTPREIYKEVQRKLKTGILVDLSPSFNLDLNINMSLDHVMIFNQEELICSKTFSKTLNYSVQEISSDTLDLSFQPDDYSRLLSIRRNLSVVCLYSDGAYEITFLKEDKTPVSKGFLWDDIKNLKTIKMREKPKFVKIQEIGSSSSLKSNFEYLSFSHERCVDDAFNVFHKLCSIPQNFYFLEQIFNKVKPVPTDLDFSNFTNFSLKWEKVVKDYFRHYNLYDWVEVIFGFSMFGDFSKFKRAAIIKDYRILNHLKSSGEYRKELSQKYHDFKVSVPEEKQIP